MLLKEKIIKEFNYCNAIANDIINNHKSKEIQEYAKKFAEIKSPLIGGTSEDWISISWGDVYIFLCDNGYIGYQVDPTGGYGKPLIEVWGCTEEEAKEEFMKEVLSLETAPIVRRGVTYYSQEDGFIDEVPFMFQRNSENRTGER